MKLVLDLPGMEADPRYTPAALGTFMARLSARHGDEQAAADRLYALAEAFHAATLAPPSPDPRDPVLPATVEEVAVLRERLDAAEMHAQMMTMSFGMARAHARGLARVVLHNPDSARAAAEVVMMSDDDFAEALASEPGAEHYGPQAWATFVVRTGLDEFFAKIGADNYLEHTVDSFQGRYVVTVQRVTGKTPANVAKEALASLDAFKANFRAAMDAILARRPTDAPPTPEDRARAEERHEIVKLFAGVLVSEGDAIIAAAAQALAESEGGAPRAWPASASPERTDEERHRLHDYSSCIEPDCKRCKEIGAVVRELRWRAGRAAQTSEPVWKEIDTSTAADAMPFWRKFVAAAAECPEDLARFVPVMKLAVPLHARLSEITLAFDHRDVLLRRQMLDDAFTRAIAAIGDRCFGKAVIVSIAQGILPPDAPTLAREDEAARAAGEVR